MIDELLSDDDDDFRHLKDHFDHDDLDDHDEEEDEHDLYEDDEEHHVPRSPFKEPEPKSSLTERKVEQLPEISSETVRVDLTYMVGKEKIALSDLKELREGSVLPISGPPDFPVTILLQEKPIAIGQLVLVENSPCIQVKHILGE